MEGIFSAATYEASEIARQSAELQSGDYALQLLQIPSLGMMALWLKHSGDDRDQDFYVPQRRAWLPLVANAVMGRDAFADALWTLKRDKRRHELPPQ